MPDYGHDLQFGSFITPTNERPELPVALAQLSEQLGYDLVTFQDHPYQPSFLDTWTLMTWVAARTERIHIAPNVLNLPLRPPAVVARSAVSLDLLSGGRFDLALGACGFWDAIQAMGGMKLTQGQGVDALGEGIDIIRGIWDASNQAPLRVAGEHHSVDGAKRGPAPAHPVPIWVGARRPRMLRLIGRAGDGWLPSLPWLESGDLAAGNRIIDESAAQHGRDPREVRRLLNLGGRFTPRRGGLLIGPSEQWVEELLPLAVEDGVSTFIVMGDDPSTLQQFAEEVAPALREAVARERRNSEVPTGPHRSAVALSRRREGIDYDGIPASLAGSVVEPGDFDYGSVRSTYMRGGAPGLVIRTTDVAQVVEALAFARRQPVPMAVRSGGHGISGRSTNDGGIVIDLGAMDGITVLDETARLVRIGAGARWGDVAAALEPHGWALSSGDYGGVGVGGLATAGGIGWLVREHGLTIDHLRAVEVVLADGSVVRATAEENADLFWAMRGAGANFGIATSFDFEVDEIGNVGWAQLVVEASDAAGFLEEWGTAIEQAPRDTTSFVMLGRPRSGQPSVAQVMAVVDSDDPETIVRRVQPFADLGPLLGQDVQLKSYAQVMANATPGPHQGQGEPVTRSGLLEHITPEFAAASARLLESGEVHFFSLRSMGGAVADVPADATAFGVRSANFAVAVFGSSRAGLDAAWEDLYPHLDGLYLSFETDLRPERLDDAFPAATRTRLDELKRKYDPDNVFRDNFNLAPPVAVG